MLGIWHFKFKLILTYSFSTVNATSEHSGMLSPTCILIVIHIIYFSKLSQTLFCRLWMQVCVYTPTYCSRCAPSISVIVLECDVQLAQHQFLFLQPLLDLISEGSDQEDGDDNIRKPLGRSFILQFFFMIITSSMKYKKLLRYIVQ